MGNKFLINFDKCVPSAKVVFTSLVCIVIMFTPLLIVVYWRPTMLHCGLRQDRDWQGPYPSWCQGQVPNVYTYIQLKYWENRFLGFLYRGPENFLTSIPMNVLYLAMTVRLAISQPLAFFSLGILGKGSKKDLSVLGRPESVPHVWYMAIQLTLVLLYANADINSRVASTLPIYYWAFSALILEGSKMSKLACFHNILYMVLNMLLFHTEIGFF